MARSLGSPARKSVDGSINGPELRRHGDRLIALMDERDAIGEDIKEVYAEARDAGFVTKILRAHVRERRMDPEVLQAQLELMQAYRDALGQLADTPLGAASAPMPSAAVTALPVKPPAKRGRKPKAQGAVEAARSHLEGEDDFVDREQRMEDDLDRIIGEPAGAA